MNGEILRSGREFEVRVGGGVDKRAVGTAAASCSPVQSSIADLDASMRSLDDALAMLFGRIGPVLGPETAQRLDEKSAKAPASCALEAALVDQRVAINRLEALVRDISSRVAL